jgi:hypothetical protein
MSKPINRHVIERARILIADESQWCRAALARDELGRQVDPTDATARQRCAFGALVAAAFELIGDLKQAHDLAGVAAREIRCTSSLINTNDTEGHAAVLALFDKALPAN